MHRWLPAAKNPATKKLSESLGLSPIVAQILAHRGYTEPDLAKSFLEPRLRNLSDPFELPVILTVEQLFV